MGNYLTRQQYHGTVFPKGEPNALVAEFFRRVALRMSGTARLRAAHQVEVHAAAAMAPVEAAPAAHAGAWVWAEAAEAIDEVEPLPPGRIPQLSAASSSDLQPPLGEQCWRLLFASRYLAPGAWTPLLASLIDHAERLRTSVPPSRALYGLSRLAFALAEAGGIARRDDAAKAAAALTSCLAEIQRPDGSLPTSLDSDDRAPTGHMAQFAIATAAAGQLDASRKAVGFLVAERGTDDNGLLLGDDQAERTESSAWVPMALLLHADDLTPLGAVLDPPIAPLPEYEITDVEARPDELVYVINAGSQRLERRFDATDFDHLLERVLDNLTRNPRARSARQHAHAAIALRALLQSAGDDGTRRKLAEVLDDELNSVFDAQDPNGGWSYAYEAVRSVVYTHAGAEATDFPDLQYTIDVAVPGIALCDAYRTGRDPKWLEAAYRAMRFLENDIGRVSWNNRLVWRLHPADDKTTRSGTAVNYELWVGYFFASLADVADDVRLAGRAREYAEEAIGYASGHLLPTGDISYGDYVDEKRTAYAAWDAYLLHEIGRLLPSHEAGEMARKIALNLGATMLPNGAIPNVSDHEEAFWGHATPRVHRHGIGPYPIRTYYQLYYVLAATLIGTDEVDALRALGFVLVNLYEPAFGDLRRGYDGRGQPDDRSGVAGGDWLLFALGSLASKGALPYAPRIREGGPRARFLDVAGSIEAAMEIETSDTPTDLGRSQLIEAQAMLRSRNPQTRGPKPVDDATPNSLQRPGISVPLCLIRAALALAHSSTIGSWGSTWATDARGRLEQGNNEDCVSRLSSAAIEAALTRTNAPGWPAASEEIHVALDTLSESTDVGRRAALLVSLAVLAAVDQRWLVDLRATADVVWQRFFLNSGHGFEDLRRQQPLTASIASEFASVFRTVHLLTGDATQRIRQEAVTRYILRNHRRFDFRFSDLPGARDPSSDASAAAYFAVAGLLNGDLPPWAESR